MKTAGQQGVRQVTQQHRFVQANNLPINTENFRSISNKRSQQQKSQRLEEYNAYSRASGSTRRQRSVPRGPQQTTVQPYLHPKKSRMELTEYEQQIMQ
jgi:hypothetical protein